MASVPAVDELRSVGLAHGLAAVGVAAAAPLRRARLALESRRAEGLHGGMAFTYRNPRRSTSPAETLPGARALVAGAYPYRPAAPAAPDPSAPRARVAAYATEDHYAALRAALGAIAAELEAAGWRARVLADDNACVDREVAYRAGLGWFGKNANILVPGHGSWVVLGAVVTDAPLEPTPAPIADGCRTCHRCIDGCPTGAIVAPGVVDARRCLAWLVQAPGVFPRALRAALRDRLYGCDDCQEVCPPNRPAVQAQSGPRPGGTVAVLDVLRAGDEELLCRFGRWYIPRRDPDALRRNALVVLGNTADGRDPAVAAALAGALRHPSGLVRAHALWAARRLGRDDLAALVAGDDDPVVQDEWAAGAEPLVASAAS